ncbi:MAG: hypothetical protein OH319_03640 [Candidatus Parvarchaeota archaeon]|nr:hypothetical protein [Candidatus Jingweiarchaeum tengchongense]MCW1298573.1 hypothetical protein [Candidatus Jingweiarchaeum tengchongense]MCW1310268.1 hypothetical protein [Candidatus Jingweiarchaeum tengchongense]
MNNLNNEKLDCCKKIEQKEGKGFLAGIAYGLIPHIGCIAFIVFSVLGVTTITTFFKPLLLNPYFFYILIELSFIFATISATVYLKRNGILSISGIKRKWKYLLTLYGTTIFVNLFLFMIIFPYATNLISNTTVTGAFVGIRDSQSTLTIQVAIPCSGHAPLITGELNKIDGVIKTEFKFPNIFTISYDSTKTSKQEILSLDVFNTYKATVLNESSIQQNSKQNIKSLSTGGSCCGGSESCTGSSGKCSCGATR